MKFSGLGQTKSFQLEEAQQLIHFRKGFRWYSSIINQLKETLTDGDKPSRIDFPYFVSINSSFNSYHCEDNLVIEHYCFDHFSKQFGFHQDVPVDIDFYNLPDTEIMHRCHHVLTRYGFLPRRCSVLETNTTHVFHEWWSKMFISSTCNQHTSDSKRKRSGLSDTNISKYNGIVGSKPKLKNIHSEKPLKPSVSSIEDDFSHVKILGVDVIIPIAPIPVIPIQSIAPSANAMYDIKKHFKSSPAKICREKLTFIINHTIDG